MIPTFKFCCTMDNHGVSNALVGIPTPLFLAPWWIDIAQLKVFNAMNYHSLPITICGRASPIS